MDMEVGCCDFVLHFVVLSMIKSFCGHVAIFFDLQTFNPIENGKYFMFCCLFGNSLPQVYFFLTPTCNISIHNSLCVVCNMHNI
jgi:hypothetical protein